MAETIVAVIGGSGLYELDGLTDVSRLSVDTPFGQPSSEITVGHLGESKLLFLARHGEGHVYLPSDVNYRANIFALKKLGAQWCISVSAVGSLKEELVPGHVVVPDQFIDRTKGRASSFFGAGICAHVSFATPLCPVLREVLISAAQEEAKQKVVQAHQGGTYICMEGPAFSTRAESHLYRSWGASIIGMTALPEAKLAREAEISYATLALVTDYDCWRTESSDVEILDILETMKSNVALAKDVVAKVSSVLPKRTPSELAANALQNAIVTSPERISAELKVDLQPIVGRYLK